MRKRIAWTTNLLNIGVLTFLILKGCSPLYGAVACIIAVTTILVATIPEALTLKEVYNDDIL